MTINVEEFRAAMKREARMFTIQAVMAAVAVFGTGVGIACLSAHLAPPVQAAMAKCDR